MIIGILTCCNLLLFGSFAALHKLLPLEIVHQIVTNRELLVQQALHVEFTAGDKAAASPTRFVLFHGVEEGGEVAEHLLVRHVEPPHLHLAGPVAGVLYVAQRGLRLHYLHHSHHAKSDHEIFFNVADPRSGIRCFFGPWIRDPGWKKIRIRDEHPRLFFRELRNSLKS
jgi:hypothetical protein